MLIINLNEEGRRTQTLKTNPKRHCSQMTLPLTKAIETALKQIKA